MCLRNMTILCTVINYTPVLVWFDNDVQQKYAPSVFEKYVTTVSYGGKDIQLNLYDTAGECVQMPDTPHIPNAPFSV